MHTSTAATVAIAAPSRRRCPGADFLAPVTRGCCLPLPQLRLTYTKSETGGTPVANLTGTPGALPAWSGARRPREGLICGNTPSWQALSVSGIDPGGTAAVVTVIASSFRPRSRPWLPCMLISSRRILRGVCNQRYEAVSAPSTRKPCSRASSMPAVIAVCAVRRASAEWC